jgi:hypothetical protein
MMPFKSIKVSGLAILLFIVGYNQQDLKFQYEKPPLILSTDSLIDDLGSYAVGDLPQVIPSSKVELKENSTPLTRRMWKIALNDVEQNIVTNQYGTYFAAGRRYTDRVYTRDIAVSGILGLNYIYPGKMKRSLMITREVRSKLGYKVSAPHVVSEIDAPWEVISDIEKDVMAQYRTNSYTRRTDDVVWLWTVDELFNFKPEIADWKWMYETGKEYFEKFYDPWFDENDGLFRGQPLFQDIGSSAYPDSIDMLDGVLLKGTSTNCLYYRAMLAMANAAEQSATYADEKDQWLNRAKALKNSIRKELVLPNGTVTYYKDRYGNVLNNQHNLGTAFAILFGILEDEDAEKAISEYPTSDKGIPLIHPFLTSNKGAHNMASWPFCSTFFLWAKEIATGKDFTEYNAALLARSMGTELAKNRNKNWGGFGSFHEKIKLPSGIIDGSGQQLWSSAAYINVCLRANMVKGYKHPIRQNK